MAEFSLGLTKTAVEGTLSLVKSAVEEEKKLREKVQNDLVFITGEFEVMQSFLQDASREHARNDKVTLTLVRQLRTLAFDVEDCVEYVIYLHLDESSQWGWLQRLWQTVNCCAPPLPLDDAVAEIRQLKARLEDVSHRSTRYILTLHGSNNNNNREQPAVTVVTAKEQPLDATTYPSSAPAFHILRDAWKATGKWRNNSMCNLQELIISGDDSLQVISVWGSTVGDDDVGTAASILTKAYWDPEICKEFKCRAWVKLTHPFNHAEFLNTLLAQFYASSSHQANTTGGVGFREEDKLAKLKQEMREQRCLIVLENVLAATEWNVIRMHLPDSKKGSRIVVSTPRLPIALLCAGEQYRVSELTKFYGGDNQFLCAFSQNKTPSDMGEFYRQLRRRRLISVWGADGDDKSNLVDILYKGIINGWFKQFEWVCDSDKADRVSMLKQGIRNREFKWHSWVDVPHPFDLKVFARRLFLNFHSDNIRASEITKGGNMGEAGLIKWCRESLFEREDCLVVINGLQFMNDWECITSNFLSSNAAAKGCIIVVTNEETMAKHCVKDDHTHLAFNAKDLKADPSIDTLINKVYWHYAIRGRKGRLFYDRKKDATEWTDKFKPHPDQGEAEEEGFRVFTVTGDDETYEKGVLRHAYYGFRVLFQQQIESCSWVDWPSHSEDEYMFVILTDFAWRLLLDFNSDDPIEKEKVAVGLMEGTITDPIQNCREFLQNKKCLVVINGLESRYHWDSIKANFFSDEQHIQSIIIVRPLEGRSNDKVLRLGTQQGFRDNFNKEFYSASFYERCKESRTHIIDEPVGRQRELFDLTWLVLVNPYRDYFLVSVWGIAGVGKSTLVRTVYYKAMLRSASHEPDSYQFSNCFEAFGWVDVPSPFNLTEFAWRLLLDLYSDHPQAKQTAMISSMTEQGQDPVLECCEILQEIRCLVVIDGLCSTEDWDLIKATFLSGPINKEGAIVVITNEEKVAMHCVENVKKRVVNVRCLEADVALNLFQKMAWEGKELNSQEMDESKSIVAKCGGLPKVMTAIGEVYRDRDIWWLQCLSDNFMGKLETDPEFHGLRPLFSWMRSYFDACSDSLKPCIFYLSIFSAEKNIRLRRLLWRWIMEGYCRDTSDGRTCEENGEKFISELVNLSIIQESASSEVFCQINGFFHEYIISRPMEDNLVFALEGRCSLNSTRGGQHLTIRSSWDRNEIVYERIDFSRLRSLTVFGKWESFFISKKLNMRLLRVLDLEDATDVEDKDLEQIAKLLTRLKFLSLRGCREITHLPSSMGGLRQLQTLDIRHTSIVTLPLFITRLEKLQYLRAGTTEAWDWEGDVLLPLADSEGTTEAWDWEGDVLLPLADSEGTTEAWDWEGDVLLPPADGEDKASSSAAAAQDTSLAATAVTRTEGGRDDSTASSSAQAVTILQAAAATTEATPTEGGTNSTAPVVLAPDAGNNRPHTLVSSILSKLCRRGDALDNKGPAAGVTVPEDIGKLAVLHTLGVVKVNEQRGNQAIFQELKKLTQLRKLGVSGINKGNIHEFCKAISDHAHLKSLSVELDKDDNLDGLDDIPQPPNSLKSLKLYGRVNKLLVWIERPENNLKKLKLHLTIEKPEELGSLESATMPGIFDPLRIRPIQSGDLNFRGWGWKAAQVVEIQCSSILHIKFDVTSNWQVKVLKVHFSGGSQSSLEISGLSQLWELKEVWLKGYTDAHKQYMQRQINEMELKKRDQVRPVLKLVQPCVTNSTSEPEVQANAPRTCVDAHSRSRLAGVVTCCARVLGDRTTE